MKKLILTAMVLTLVAAAGCAYSPVGMESSTIPLDQRAYNKMARVEGSASTVYFLGIPFGSHSPARDAVDDAKQNSGADALIDVTMDKKTTFLFFLIIQKTTVKGTAVGFLNLPAAAGAATPGQSPNVQIFK